MPTNITTNLGNLIKDGSECLTQLRMHTSRCPSNPKELIEALPVVDSLSL